MNRKNLSNILFLQHINPFFYDATMGSSLGQTLAKAFLCHFEKKWLSECSVEFLTNVYNRYVDDTFVSFNSYLQLFKFLDYMNHQHPNIKFTFEVWKSNNFSFLYVKICRENNKFTIPVFRKSTFSGVFTTFDSVIPISYKNGLVNTLMFQCFKVCSSYENLHTEIVYLKKCFKRDIYPDGFVDRCIKKFFDKLYITKKIIKRIKNQFLIILQLLGHLSFETRNRLNSCIRNKLRSCSLWIEFQLKTHQSSLFNFKDSIPKYFRSHVISKFSCSYSNPTYYGESERHIFVRASEHLGITPLTQERVKKPKKSAIVDHILIKGHNSMYDDFPILSPQKQSV